MFRAGIGLLLAWVLLFTVQADAQVIDRASDTEVDRLMLLAAGGNMTRLREEFERLGASATPRLAEHIRGDKRNDRVIALVCLQFCWSEVARDAVIEAIPEADTQSRKLAFQVLGRHETGEQLAKVLKPLTESRDERVAGPAIQYILRSVPDKALLKRAAGNRRLLPYLSESLPRYYGQDLHEPTRTLIRRAKVEQRANLIVALLHQQDDSSEARKLIVSNLTRGPAMLHDRAADFLSYHGTPEELPALEAALQREREPYAKASIQGAIVAINKRVERFSEPGVTPPGDYPDDPALAYRQAYETLGKAYTQANRRAAIQLLANAEPYEPYWRFGMSQENEATVSRITERLVLQVLSSGYTLRGVSLIGNKPVQPQDPIELPEDLVTASLIAPVRNYFDEKRKSFGIFIRGNGGPFANTHHMGDDVAWDQDHETIVAIGDGVVRRVVIGQVSWGGLVVIEHRDTQGNRFCSLYSHLGPLVAVRENDVVNQGQKVGSLGRTHTWEGGGYRSHLHFGIHQGPFEQEQRWVTGYLSHDRFEGDHGWVDPQAYIRERLSR
ncbi:MAG: M23 family metallopeptidase [Phycisphaeraceae bacterium]